MFCFFVHCDAHARLDDEATFILVLEYLEFAVHRITGWFVSPGLRRGRYTGFCYSERWQSTFHIIPEYAHRHVLPVWRRPIARCTVCYALQIIEKENVLVRSVFWQRSNGRFTQAHGQVFDTNEVHWAGKSIPQTSSPMSLLYLITFL